MQTCNKLRFAALVVTMLLALSGCAHRRVAFRHCSNCGLRSCCGCQNLPDPVTAGYHCTMWSPLADPCWLVPHPVHADGMPLDDAPEEAGAAGQPEVLQSSPSESGHLLQPPG